MKKQIKRIATTGPSKAKDASGRAYRIFKFTEILVNCDDPDSEEEGLHSIQTADGLPVSRISKGKYELFDGEVLTSDDPDAP